MRAQTASFVVQTKLKLPQSVENYLEKSFRVVASAYNEALGLGLRRFKALSRNSSYQELLAKRRDTDAQRDCDKTLFEMRKSYGLTEHDLQVHLSHCRKNPDSSYRRLNSSELQVIASQAYKTLERVIFYKIKANAVRFRSKHDSNMSYRSKVNTTGTRLVESHRKGIAYRLYLHKASTFVDIPVKAFNRYQQLSLSHSEKIKYVQIVRKTIRGKHVYILQIVCQGFPPAKISRGRETVGIDPGISTVAYVSNSKVALVDLVPKDINQKEKLMKLLDRRIERGRRINNPDCYHDDGTIKKGAKFKRPSNRQLRLQLRRQKAHRSLSEERQKLQGQLVNRIVSQARVIKIEDLSVKNLQGRIRDVRINPETNRPFSKKRFGKSIFRAAPSAFRNALKIRAQQLGIDFEVISPREIKPSQYNHITQTFEKKSLSTRIHDLSDDVTGVQRDLYSAFLIGHVENGCYQQEQLKQDFPNFYRQMKEFLREPRQTNRLDWYLK